MNIPNSICLQNNTAWEIPLPHLIELVQIVFREEKVEPQSTLNLAVVQSKEMRKYNRLYRGVDACTDVLSFPSEQTFVPLLGDIIIDMDSCFQQKGDKFWQEEFCWLFLHGFLHLLGYDHVSDGQKKEMETKEKMYWKIFKESVK